MEIVKMFIIMTKIFTQSQYIVMMEHNVVTWGELNNPMHDSEPAHHFKNHQNHSFNLFVITNASNNKWVGVWKQNTLF